MGHLGHLGDGKGTLRRYKDAKRDIGWRLWRLVGD